MNGHHVPPNRIQCYLGGEMYNLGPMLRNTAAAKSLQSRPTLCDPMDCSLPGFSVHGILQARTLEWVAISFSKETLE